MKYRLLIVLAASLWGLDGILRTTLYTLPPSVVVFAEHFIGFVILSLILIFQHPKASRRFKSGQNAYYIVIVSLFSGVVGTMAFTAALARVQYIPVSIVFLIQKLQPIFTIIAAHIVLKERPARTFWYYATIALVAGYFMTFPQGVQIDANTQYVSAAVFSLIAAISWGTSTIFSKKLLSSSQLFSVTFQRFAVTTLIALVAVFLLGDQRSLLQISSSQFISLCFIACSTGMVALLIYYRGLTHTSAHISCILELAFPLTGFAIDLAQGRLSFDLVQYLAVSVLVFCIYRIASFVEHT